MATINAIDCFITGNTYGLNFNGNVVNIGEIWYTESNSLFKEGFTGCVEITSLTDEPSSNSLLQTEYATCYDCYSNNYGVFSFFSCGKGESIFFDVSAFTPTFFSNFDNKGTYFIDSILDGTPIIGCFEGQIGLLTQEEYNRLQTENLISNTVLSVSAFTSCEDCVSNSPLIYTVERCTEPTTFDTVQLPSNLTNRLISYTNGTDEFCGNIVGVSSSLIPTHTFVSLFPKDTICDVCLDVKNEKFIIENCVNSDIQEVVWGSQLFQNGSVSNLQLGGGCYEVISATTSAVTQTLFLDFEPQPDCQACVECHGVFYEYALCSDPLVKVGEILSYEYISGNTAVYHPSYNQFVVTLNTITASTSYDTFYSLLTKTDCLTPDPSYFVWEAEICNLGTIIYITTTDGMFTNGDTVQTLWGETNFLCATLIQDVTGLVSSNIYFHTNTKFNTCEDCYNTTIGIRTLDCFTLESEVVDLTYTAWTQTTNYGGFNGSYLDCFLDSNGLCRTIVDVCPLDPIGNTISVNQQYLNCNICTIFNPRPAPTPPLPPISAGTEYFGCNICCPCDSGGTITQIVLPHPQWTNGQGRLIYLLDAVTLGGTNGLNS
jgi:hypothetical protein